MVTTKDVHPSNLELILAQMYKVERHLHHFCFLSPSDRLVMSLYTYIGLQILLNQRWTLTCV